MKELSRDEPHQPTAWVLYVEQWRAWSGPFSALDLLDEPFEVTVGPHPNCASRPVRPPGGFESHRRISIQPFGVDSCIEWWTVDLFLDEEGAVAAVTLDLYEP